MPCRKRVRAHDKVATSVAEADHEGVRLREITMMLELLKPPELGVWRKTALNHLDGSTCKVGLRSLEKQSTMPWLVFVRDLEKLVCHFLLCFCAALSIRCVVSSSTLATQVGFPCAAPTTQPCQCWKLGHARVGGKYPAHSESRASPLRVLPIALGLLSFGDPDQRLVVCSQRIVLPSGSPWLFRCSWLASGVELRGHTSSPGLHRL